MTEHPAGRHDAAAGVPERAGSPPPVLPTTAKPRILVVDDEPSMREMLRIVLQRDHYDVVVAKNGTEAIERLQVEPFDMLLTDIRMPDLRASMCCGQPKKSTPTSSRS